MKKAAWRIANLLPSKVLLIGAITLSQTVSAQMFEEISLQSQLSTTVNVNGVAIADFDNDNDLDLFVVNRWDGKGPTTSQLFRNENDGTFVNVTESSGIQSTHDYTGIVPDTPHPVGEKMGASWGDYDNDGFPDLFLTNAYYFELYHNNQDGTFTDVIAGSGLPLENECVNNVGLWFDYNNDSYLDLYVAGVFSMVNCRGIYENNGDGTFTNVTEASGLKESGLAAWTAIPIDVNEDGFQDLYIANDFGVPNGLYLNNSGESFTDQGESYGVTDTFKDGMGVAYSDFNNDGWYDLYITNINESSLYQNQGNNSFLNVAGDLDVEFTGWAWGCQFEDFDHDLDVDLVVSNGYYDSDYERYYENTHETGLTTFLDKSEEVGIAEQTISNGLIAFDYDNDGDLDVLIGRTGDHLGFYENKTITINSSSDQHWVQLDLVGTQSNRDAIGTNVEIEVGGKLYRRYYHGAALLAQSQVPVHFGLAGHEQIDKVTIKWPLGLIETYEDLPVNSFIRITEGEGYELLNLSSNKIPGCTDPNSCNYDPSATFNDGSCAYLGSKSISGADEVGLLSQHPYSYPSTLGSSYEWAVSGGHIVEGQGTSSIVVDWGISPQGAVIVTEIGTCYSEPVAKAVSITTDQLPEDISVARLWNEAILGAIRMDYARPTVHARNLFHSSIAMYDAWAIINGGADTYLVGKQLYNYNNVFDGFESLLSKDETMDMAISYAAYRLLCYRFKDSPNAEETKQSFDALMYLLGYDPYHAFSDYRGGDPAALGNFIANSIIEYGLIDGANESDKYSNLYYQPLNEPLAPVLAGNPTMQDANRWQPLIFQVFIDQAGNVTTGNIPEFLSPEWGSVDPFALKDDNATKYVRDGAEYKVFHDPGSPPMINGSHMSGNELDIYKWNFSLVSVWSAHLDPYDGVNWDISPRSIGNIDFNLLPTELGDYDSFYDLFEGGDIGVGRSTNPVTGESYEPQIVPRGDYARVLAEFWADGPDSETPPGHWFTILNYVNDHSSFERKFKGLGSVLDPLEWDVKAYFTLGGAMHDAAVAAWGVKGWYDYVRPISAIRYMADMGQSSDSTLSNYHQNGLPLMDGYIEVVEEGDPLAGADTQHLGKIKLLAWKGHDYIDDPSVDEAGVDWILAENWWPYQRPSFVTPPFAGYVSGHSTYSRAAAEVMTRLTGSEYFPGGMGEFIARKNEFLVFEEGPSQDVILQWATYRDASDQCSLSRIWGGIHPPADDIAGRMIGARIGMDAFEKAEGYFKGDGLQQLVSGHVYPVPSSDAEIFVTHTQANQEFTLYDLYGKRLPLVKEQYNPITQTTSLRIKGNQRGIYILKSGMHSWKIMMN